MKKSVCAGILVLAAACPAVFAQPGNPPVEVRPTQTQVVRAPSTARLANADQVRRQLGLVPEFDNVPGIEAIKIAVLDYGFDGQGTRPYLPAGAVLVEHYDPEFVRRFKLGDPEYRKGFAPRNSHGRTLAQIVWGVTGFHPNGPKFYLLNANGPTMLRRAVRYAIEAKVDIILFSGTFEGGGNGDGRGAINRIVYEALAEDILWINASGNYGGRVYNGPVEVLPSGYLRLGSGPDSTALRFRNLLDENTVAVTLTWNDYREQEDAGTDKDLDLYVEDGQGRVIGASAKTQVPPDKVPGPEETRNPRERVTLADLPASGDQDYLIRIRAKKGNFSSSDQLRVLVSSSREAYFDPQANNWTPAVRFVDASGKGEMFPPADNPLVLTVGELGPSCSRGPTADHRVKPDVILPDSRALFSNGEMTAGTSNSAAYFAGVVALMRAAEPGLRTRHLLWFAHHAKARKIPVGSDGMPLRTPDYGGDGRPRQSFVNTSIPLRGLRISMSYPRTAPAAPGARPSFSEVTLPVAPRPARQLRLWQTPIRQELAEKVRNDR